jgi:hypothetical protein
MRPRSDTWNIGRPGGRVEPANEIGGGVFTNPETRLPHALLKPEASL